MIDFDDRTAGDDDGDADAEWLRQRLHTAVAGEEPSELLLRRVRRTVDRQRTVRRIAPVAAVAAAAVVLVVGALSLRPESDAEVEVAGPVATAPPPTATPVTPPGDTVPPPSSLPGGEPGVPPTTPGDVLDAVITDIADNDFDVAATPALLDVFIRWRSVDGAASYRILHTRPGAVAPDEYEVLAPREEGGFSVEYDESTVPALSSSTWVIVALDEEGDEIVREGVRATVPDVIGQLEWNAYAILRTAGIVATAAGAPADCGQAESEICTQSRAAGEVVDPGTRVGLRAQG